MNHKTVNLLQEINIAVVNDLWRVLDRNATVLPALVPRLIIPDSGKDTPRRNS